MRKEGNQERRAGERLMMKDERRGENSEIWGEERKMGCGENRNQRTERNGDTGLKKIREKGRRAKGKKH